MQGHHRHRRALALVTCVLWLLGVEVLPGLHLALHRGDHTHGADGTIVLGRGGVDLDGDHDAVIDEDHDHDHDAVVDEDHDHDHDHDAVVDEDHDHDHDAVIDEDHDHDHDAVIDEDHDHADADADGPARAGDQPSIDHPRHAHRAGGVAHHAAALLRPPPPLLAPHPVARTTWRLELAAASRPRGAAIARPTSRGPPAG